jgi:hypothetical protein
VATSAQRSNAARIGALARWANEDPRPWAEKGQAGLQRKFYDQTDPTLPEPERQRRARALFRLHMARLSHARSLKIAAERAARAVT